MSTIFRVQLESIRPFIVNELGDFRVEYINDKGRLAGRRKVEFSRRSLGHYLGHVRSERTGYRPHKVEKSGHTLLVSVLLSGGNWFPHSHGLIKSVIASFNACLFLELFSLKPRSEVFVSTIFLDLNSNDLLEGTN